MKVRVHIEFQFKSCLTGLRKEGLKEYTMAEVNKHDTPENRCDDRVYLYICYKYIVLIGRYIYCTL